MTRQVSLSLNDQPVELDYFVQGFIDHTIGGMLATLKGTGEIKDLDISLEGDEITINLNSAAVPTNPFVSKIITNTIMGMVSSLKGAGEIRSVKITIER